MITTSPSQGPDMSAESAGISGYLHSRENLLQEAWATHSSTPTNNTMDRHHRRGSHSQGSGPDHYPTFTFTPLCPWQNCSMASNQTSNQPSVPVTVTIGRSAYAQLRLPLPKVHKCKDWCKKAKAKILYMGITEDIRKVALQRSWAGRILLNFWEKQAVVLNSS